MNLSLADFTVYNFILTFLWDFTQNKIMLYVMSCNINQVITRYKEQNVYSSHNKPINDPHISKC